MKKINASILLLSSALLATPEVNTISEVFSEAKTSGNVKYYYIQTDKDFSAKPSTSANANSVGGQLHFETASLHGVSAKVTFMTTNGFALSGPVDTSILGKDNGAQQVAGLNAPDADDSFSVLGEALLTYNYSDFGISIGREVLKTPLIDAKEVRMLPSAVEGGYAEYRLNKKSKIELAYLDKFKQRTSSTFINILEHALGTQTEAITGSRTGRIIMGGATYKKDAMAFKAYDYYADDFMNSLYLDAGYTHKFDGFKMTIAGQYINQSSVGNADSYLADSANGYNGAISSNALAAKVCAFVGESKFMLAYSKVFRSEENHDSLVLPWDGTPLFTNMITSNDLFQSLYGHALNADSVYIGGSQGIKLGYKQGFDFTGVKGFSTVLSYLNTSNSRKGFDKNQNDYNVVLGYKVAKAFSLALKGIWVHNNTGISADGTVSQLDKLSQYRVIANYKF